MDKLDELKRIETKPQLARLLVEAPSTLTNILYRIKPTTQYTSFTVPKKNGGTRTIFAPTTKLKALQSKLSILLLDCIDEINAAKPPKPKGDCPKVKLNTKIFKVKISNSATKQQPSLSHGFVRHRSIITNAMMHLNQKNVLNIDLEDFFGSFNFGRVRGFFIKNKNFKLQPNIATVIAQIACYDNKLPQGSPCSPVITNLITHSLDIRLASLAKKYSCTYSRYADDITFSTRKSFFPHQIMRQEGNDEYIASKKLRTDIKRAGFSINDKKTRIQYKDSRQDVTGLIVNKKPNVKKEYWRTVRSQCHSLFHTGSFTKKTAVGEVDGNINELEGQLNFIDQVDHFNRPRLKSPIDHTYVIANHRLNTFQLLNGREKTFSRFLYFRYFYGNAQPTILCEGKTDNIYLKSAIRVLVSDFEALAMVKAKVKPKEQACKLLVRFINYTARTKFFMGLDTSGGSGNLTRFTEGFDEHYIFYKANKPQHPVIIVADNDSGFKDFRTALKKIPSTALHPPTLDKKDHCKANFIHVMHNLYVVLTPLNSAGEKTDIESLFDEETRLKQHAGRCFNTIGERRVNVNVNLSKASFANHIIKAQKNTINFDGLKPLLNRIVDAIAHYDSIKSL